MRRKVRGRNDMIVKNTYENGIFLRVRQMCDSKERGKLCITKEDKKFTGKDAEPLKMEENYRQDQAQHWKKLCTGHKKEGHDC